MTLGARGRCPSFLRRAPRRPSPREDLIARGIHVTGVWPQASVCTVARSSGSEARHRVTAGEDPCTARVSGAGALDTYVHQSERDPALGVPDGRAPDPETDARDIADRDARSGHGRRDGTRSGADIQPVTSEAVGAQRDVVDEQILDRRVSQQHRTGLAARQLDPGERAGRRVASDDEPAGSAWRAAEAPVCCGQSRRVAATTSIGSSKRIGGGGARVPFPPLAPSRTSITFVAGRSRGHSVSPESGSRQPPSVRREIAGA